MVKLISKSDALKTLASMFQHMDSAVIKMVLEANGGHMERTVEQLLKMSAPGGDAAGLPVNAEPAAAAASGLPAASSGAHDDAEFKAAERDAPAASSSHPTGADFISDRLAADFLRPPSFFSSATAPSQIDQDAALAQMLQDRLFMEELRTNPEFFMTGAPGGGSRRRGGARGGGGGSQAASGGDGGHKSSELKEKWHKLSDAVKAKLSAIASRFSRQRGHVDEADRGSYGQLDEDDGGLMRRSEPFSLDDDLEDPDRPGVQLQDRRRQSPAAGHTEPQGPAGKSRHIELQEL